MRVLLALRRALSPERRPPESPKERPLTLGYPILLGLDRGDPCVRTSYRDRTVQLLVATVLMNAGAFDIRVELNGAAVSPNTPVPVRAGDVLDVFRDGAHIGRHRLAMPVGVAEQESRTVESSFTSPAGEGSR